MSNENVAQYVIHFVYIWLKAPHSVFSIFQDGQQVVPIESHVADVRCYGYCTAPVLPDIWWKRRSISTILPAISIRQLCANGIFRWWWRRRRTLERLFRRGWGLNGSASMGRSRNRGTTCQRPRQTRTGSLSTIRLGELGEEMLFEDGETISEEN